MAGFDSSLAGSQGDFWCKNRLQEYTQRASIALPVYQSINEGAQHAPQFRACVWVDGLCFVSPYTFPNRKMAEKDAAKHALAGIMHKVKNESSAYIRTDTVFCKSIINEYAKKMNLGTPIYSTTVTKAVLPIFVSILTLNNGYYYGEPGKNKKEAEQFAARAAIISILASESSMTMSEIVKSKFRFYDALKKLKESSKVEGGNIPAVVDPLYALTNKQQVVYASGGAVVTPLENASINNKQEVYGSGGTVSTPLENVSINNKHEVYGSGGSIPLENDSINDKQEVYGSGGSTPSENGSINNKQEVDGSGSSIATPSENASINNKLEVYGSGGTVATPLVDASITNKQEVYGSRVTIATPSENTSINSKQEVYGSGGAVATHLVNASITNKQEVDGSAGPVTAPLENAPINNKQEVYGSGGTVDAPPTSLLPYPTIQFIRPQPTVEQNSTDEAGLLLHHEFRGLKPETSPAAQLAVPGTTLEQHSSAQATHPPRHDFKKPEAEPSSTTIAPPLEFIPLDSENAKTPPTSGKKRRRKGKKKQDQSPLPIATIPQDATQLILPQPTLEQNSTAEAGLLPRPGFIGLKPATSPAAQLAVPGTTLEQHSSAQDAHPPCHDFKKLEAKTSSTTIAPPLEIIPITSENAKPPTTSGKKRRGKGKKQEQSPLPIASVPQDATPAAQTNPITG